MVRPKELVFLLDKSGSMMGAPVERAKALMLRALRAMGPDDTFQIVAFDGATQAMSPAPLPATPENVARAEGFLSALSGGGGTEMLRGIRAALVPPEDPRRLRMVVFCTDGFIGNEAHKRNLSAGLKNEILNNTMPAIACSGDCAASSPKSLSKVSRMRPSFSEAA